MVVGWIFGGDRYHATSKGAELSYKLGYLISEALVRPIRPFCSVCPICPDIIRILRISMFCGHYPHFVNISVFC